MTKKNELDKPQEKNIIGENVIKRASEMAAELLNSKASEIAEAYRQADELFQIPVKIYFSEAKNKVGIRVRATIRFPTDHVKDSKVMEISENQMGLFTEEPSE